MSQNVGTFQTHLSDKSDGAHENAMIFLVEQISNRRYVNFHELGHFSNYSDGTNDGLLFQVRIGVFYYLLDVDGQIATHLGRQYGAERAQSKTSHILIAVR